MKLYQIGEDWVLSRDNDPVHGEFDRAKIKLLNRTLGILLRKAGEPANSDGVFVDTGAWYGGHLNWHNDRTDTLFVRWPLESNLTPEEVATVVRRYAHPDGPLVEEIPD